MFNNIGGKIKTYAEMTSWIGILASIVLGVLIMFVGETFKAILLGLLICIVGSLASWISCFVIYGFGQLVENSDILVETLAPNYSESHSNNVQIDAMEEGKMETIYKDYSNSSWAEAIRDLSNEELLERMNSEDWQEGYRVLCKKELDRRQYQS